MTGVSDDIVRGYLEWSQTPDDVHQISTLVDFIPDDVGWASWDPSISLNEGPADREHDLIRLTNNLCDALARNGFWWDRHGWVHRA